MLVILTVCRLVFKQDKCKKTHQFKTRCKDDMMNLNS